MTGRLVLGVDPGKTGGLAVLDGAGGLLIVDDMPVVDPTVLGVALRAFLADIEPYTPAVAYVEVQSVRPRQAGGNALMTGYGSILGALGMAGIPTVLVTSAVWKVAAGLRGKDKTASRSLAMSLWPDWADSFVRVKDDGRAEAALIARHGWQERADR